MDLFCSNSNKGNYARRHQGAYLEFNELWDLLVAFPQCLWGRTQPGSFRSPQQEMYSSLKTKCKSLSYISPICVNITRSPWFPSAFVSTKNVSVTLFFWRKFRESRDYTGIGRIIPFCQRKVHICCQQQRSGQHSGLVLAP